MVEPLTALQEKVRYYLDEWPDHPGLLKILDITTSLLAMPLCTPLSKVCYEQINICMILVYFHVLSCPFFVCFLKALLGLQLLAMKAQTLQENDSKFVLKGNAESLFTVLSRVNAYIS
jgi:midasin